MKYEIFQTGILGVNTYLVYDEEKREGFVVDPGGYSKRLSQRVNELGVLIKALVLTHGHADHIMGVPDFKKEWPQCQLVAAAKEAELLGDSNLNETSGLGGHPLTLTCDISVKDGDTMEIGDMTLKFFNTPGHTPGGMLIVLEDLCFCGDTIFRRSVGRTDLKGGSPQDLVRSIQNKIYRLPDDTVLLPGHMGATTVGEEKLYNPFVRG